MLPGRADYQAAIGLAYAAHTDDDDDANESARRCMMLMAAGAIFRRYLRARRRDSRESRRPARCMSRRKRA